MIPLNSKAPVFQLPDTDGKPFGLEQFTDRKYVVMVFYPFDWSPVCSDQLSLYSSMFALFDKRDAVLLGISTDSWYCHAAFAEQRKIRFPLLSDFEPKGRTARAYGVFNEREGRNDRALIVLDKNRTVVWSFQAEDDVNPGADGIINALDELTSNL